MSGLKKRLDDVKGKWVEELPHVLWTYWTTPRRSTRETSFSMTYGAEAVIPLEIGFPMLGSLQFLKPFLRPSLQLSVALALRWHHTTT